MATIFEAVASANRLNASLAKSYQPQLNTTMAQLAITLGKSYQPQLNTTMLGQLGADLAKMNHAHFAGLSASLNASLARAFLPQSTLLSQALVRTYQPLLDAVLALGHLNYDSLNIGAASSTGDRLPQRLTDREIAAMLTVAAFLFVYISFGLLIKHSPYAAKLAATDGPTPFEAAMAVGALVFWLWMYRSRGSNGE